MADRAYDGDGFRNGAPRPSFRPGRGARTPAPERYKARNAIERGIGWLKQGCRVATRYDKYAHRFLGFLYLAGTWLWLKSYLNTT